MRTVSPLIEKMQVMFNKAIEDVQRGNNKLAAQRFNISASYTLELAEHIKNIDKDVNENNSTYQEPKKIYVSDESEEHF